MDSTQERDDKLLNLKIENEVKKYGILKGAFTKIAESEATLSKSRVSCFESISKIEETDNQCNNIFCYLYFHRFSLKGYLFKVFLRDAQT